MLGVVDQTPCASKKGHHCDVFPRSAVMICMHIDQALTILHAVSQEDQTSSGRARDPHRLYPLERHFLVLLPGSRLTLERLLFRNFVISPLLYLAFQSLFSFDAAD